MNLSTSDRQMKDQLSGLRWKWIVFLILVTTAVVAGAYTYYAYEFDRIRQDRLQELAVIGNLKAQQIHQWRQELLADIRVLTTGPLFQQQVEAWLRKPKDEGIIANLRKRLEVERKARDYADALIMSPEGHIIVSASEKPLPVTPAEEIAVRDAVIKRTAVLSGLYRASQGTILINAVAPILDPKGEPLAVGVFRIPPEKLLYPLISSWPTPSLTAETLLIRRDGDEVLFLNNLRHRDNTALSLREPLTLQVLPAVQAVLGKTGPFEGKDYRGVEVMADLRPIFDSSWFMVAKVDRSEVMKEARYRGYVFAVFSGMFVLLAAFTGGWIYRHRQANLYKDLYRLKREQLEVEEKFRTTLYSIGDAVITTDTQGFVKHMNPVAEELTGWKESEARDKPLDAVFHIVNEESRKIIETPVQQVLRQGMVLGLANHTILIAKNGTERPIADSGAPIRGEDGSIYGVVLVFRDQTEERAKLKALRDSEQRCRIVADHNYDWEYWITPDGRLEYCAPSCERITGYRSEEFIRDPKLVDRIVHPDDWAVFQQHLNHDMHSSQTCEADYRIVARTGEVVWISHCCTPVYSREGTFLGRRISSRDITERKKVEEDLNFQKLRFQSLADNSPFGMVVIQSDGTFTYANSKFTEMCGYDLNDVKNGREWFRKAYPDAAYRHEIIADWIEDRKGRVPGESRPRVFTVTCKNGTEKILHFRPVTLSSGEDLMTCEDITDRKRFEAALSESEARYRQLADVTFEGILFHDQGVLLRANDQFFQMFGYRPDELVGTQIMEKTLSPDSVQTVRTHIAERSTESYEALGLRKDGTTFPIEVRARLQEEEGKTIRAVAIRDRSESKMLETQLLQAQKMEAVGTLAGGIAHDFNNLLQIILGYGELILRRKKEEDRDYADLQKIYQAGKRGADLVKSLLMFGRKVSPKLSITDLNHEILEVQKLLSRTIPKTIKIDLRLSGNVEPVEADSSQVGQILMNLGINARDAMPDGGTLAIETTSVELDKDYCATHPEVKPGQYVVLTISDTGHGMDKETIGRIFDPFFSTKEVGKGTGLGLATVYGIVKQHNGHITCHSEPGKGTTFKIYFPVSGQEQAEEFRGEEVPVRGGTETILLVDDEEELRDLGKSVLTGFGYDVIAASNGNAALEIFKKKREEISLIILDLIMPEMDGKVCLKEILDLAPDAKILIASGYSDGGVMNDTVALGAKAFVEKPYDTRKLTQKVRKVLDGN